MLSLLPWPSLRRPKVAALWLPPSGRVACEDVVARRDGLVAGKAGVERGIVGGLALLIELGVPPAARRGVLLRVLDHELEVPGRRVAGDERLFAAEGPVVLLR